jgi:predicted metalloprotease with PDZ domain
MKAIYSMALSGSRSLAVIAAVAGSVCCARADIKYTVEAKPNDGILHVTMEIPNTSNGCKLQIPNWGPGGYVLRDGFARVQNLSATDSSGKQLKLDTKIEVFPKPFMQGDVEKVASNRVCTWTVAPADKTIVQYDVPSPLNDGSLHWAGPATYIYETSRLRERCVLDIKVPKGWPVYTGLVETKMGSHEYTAKTYDVLADNPVSTGDLTVDSYISRGKTHWIVMRGAPRAKVDRAKLIKACKFVSDMETDFFGDSAPYDHYVWHFAVNDNADGAGGLEHLASTEITLAQGVGPRAVDVLAHEFFHLWNVKRIRSKVLGPFDYTKLPETGAIWWLEGVTDYYAYTLLHRYGWTDDAGYFATIASNLSIVRRNPAHKEIGPNEASMRVDEDSNGRGNSNGYHISYYNLGWLAGMCLDIEMRSQTEGRHTLDDVEHALWNLCKDDKPGFDEDEIRNQYVKFGGRPMGLVYDRIVMWPDGMRLEDTLAKVGLALVAKPEPYVELGFAFGGGFGGGGLRVTSVGASAAGKLEVGDSIVAVNGVDLSGEPGRAGMAALTRDLRTAVAGKPIKLSIARSGKAMDVEVTPVSASRSTYSVERMANPSAQQKQLGDAWLAKMTFKP